MRVRLLGLGTIDIWDQIVVVLKKMHTMDAYRKSRNLHAND